MISIIVPYKEDIYNYLKHIDNINKKIKINIQILILSFKNNILIENIDYSNLSVFIYNYNELYNDSFYNEIVSKAIYDIILFTNSNIFLTEPILEYILLNNINKENIVRCNVFELKNIPNLFFDNYNNNIFEEISNEVKFINNENNKNIITTEEYINNFNNNNNALINISNKNIIENELFYLNNSDEFLLIHKELLLKYGFNKKNNNKNYSCQYLILHLIKNNVNMIKLPYILSVYKKISDETIPILDKNVQFSCSNYYNNSINYSLYDLKESSSKKIIRNHIKVLNGISNNDLINKNNELLEDNKKLKKSLEDKNIEINETHKIKNLLQQKIKESEISYEDLLNKYKDLLNKQQDVTDKLNIIKKKYIDKLSIINSNINEIIINEKKNIFI